MTERKPPGMKTQDWVEAQIKQAQARGEFDDLPGAGKPLPKLADPHDPDWWVKDFIRREKIETDALLPPSVQLRKEKQALQEKLSVLRTEAEVRDYLQDLNRRILLQIRDATGVVVPVGPVDEDEMFAQWLKGHEARQAARAHARASEPTPDRKRTFWQKLFS
jgi:DnaJ-like protein